MKAHALALSRALALAAGLALAPIAARPVEAQYSGRLQAPWVKDHVAGILIGLETREPIGGVPDQPAEGPRVVTLSLHHHLSGVLHRIGFVRKSLDLLLSRSDTIFMTGAEICDWYVKSGGLAAEA